MRFFLFWDYIQKQRHNVTDFIKLEFFVFNIINMYNIYIMYTYVIHMSLTT